MNKLNYQLPDSILTLREGLAEYYQHNSGLLVEPSKLSKEEQKVLEAHDICHILFGCDTTPSSELLIETCSVFGTTLSWREYLIYIQHPIVRESVEQLGWWVLVKSVILSLPKIVQAIANSLRMNKKWSPFDYDRYLDKSLRDIRLEFGIKIIV